MARVKVTENSLQQLLQKNNLPSTLSLAASISTTVEDLATHFGESPLVVKVDQGIKKRGKQGLVAVNLTTNQVITQIKQWSTLGWTSFIVVRFLPHESYEEHYLSLELVRTGWRLIWGDQGGINIEDNWDQTVTDTLSLNSPVAPFFLPTPVQAILPSLLPVMRQSNLVFLEINPLVMIGSDLHPLDLAGLLDNTAKTTLTLVPDKDASELEIKVAALDAATPSSLKCRLVNKDGSIWMLLSGGGASLVLADEVADQGMGAELGNYGEYSGSPTTDDTQMYTSYILDAVLVSKAAKKVIIIAGGVANFTDVKQTFLGIIAAFKAKEPQIVEQGVKVFVRRGGPNESAGLKLMRDYLTEAGLLGSVHGHEVLLTKVVDEVKEFLYA